MGEDMDRLGWRLLGAGAVCAVVATILRPPEVVLPVASLGIGFAVAALMTLINRD